MEKNKLTENKDFPMRFLISRKLSGLTMIILLIWSMQIANGQVCTVGSSYGSGGDCSKSCNTLAYNGAYGNLVIPIKFHKGAGNTSVNTANISALVAGANTIFNAQGVNVKFVVVDAVHNHASLKNSTYCAYSTIGPADCLCNEYGESSYKAVLDVNNLYLNSLNVFLYNEIKFEKSNSSNPCDVTDYRTDEANSFFPNVEPGGATNYMVMNNATVNSTNSFVMAHELGHLLGLYHTFEDVFTVCGGGDGIGDTPVDANGNVGTATGNLMDYPANSTPSITQCQKAKMLDVLFTCRASLCSNPGSPDVQSSSGLNITTLNYSLNATLESIFVRLNSLNGTNTENFAAIKLKDANGVTIQSWFAKSLNLESVFTSASLPRLGSYTLEVKDSSVYSTCESLPKIIQINFESLSSTGRCFDIVYANYYYICGPLNLFQIVGTQYRYGGRRCDTPPVIITNGGTGVGTGGGSGSGGGGGTGPGNPGGGDGGSNVRSGSTVPTITKREECQECAREIVRKALLAKSLNGGN